MSVAQQLAEFATTTTSEQLPVDARKHAAMLIASTIGSAAAGRSLQSGKIVETLAIERGGKQEASLWFSASDELPAPGAAQVNAVFSDGAASDDSDLRAVVHLGTPLTTSCLAMAERCHSNGNDVLTAMVIGYEVAGRIIDAIPRFRQRGFHGSVCAIFGAAVAAGRLLQLDTDQMANAIALSATSIGGLNVSAQTSTAREYHAGLATLLGMNAALVAQLGFTAESQVLEQKRGFFETIGGGDGEEAGEVATRDFGSSWDIMTDMAIKLAPGGHPYHAMAEAAAAAVAQGNIAPEDIESIVVSRPHMTTLPGSLDPTDLIGMAHSAAYFAAAGAVDGGVSWTHTHVAKINDPNIHRMLDKVQVGHVPLDVDAHRYRQGATVEILTKNGTASTKTVYQPRGSSVFGIDWTDVDLKYRTLVATTATTAERIEESLELIHSLAELPDASLLPQLLRT